MIERSTTSHSKVIELLKERFNTYIWHILLTCVMSNINMTIVLPEELKEKIRRLKRVNWSEVARKAFEEEIKKIERVEAAGEIDRLRRESKVKWDGVEVIRKWRNSH